MTRVSVPAIKCNQNGRLFYVAVLSSDILKEMCFVSRKKEEPIKGFQRLLNQRRASDIASYLDDSKGVICFIVIDENRERLGLLIVLVATDIERNLIVLPR